MTQQEATKLFKQILFRMARIRSQLIEGIQGMDTSIDNLSPTNLMILQATNPALFGDSPISAFNMAMAMQGKEEHLSPIDLYNLLNAIYRDEFLPTLIEMTISDDFKLPTVSPLPQWLSEWSEDEQTQ